MVVLTIKNLATNKVENKTFISKDKLEKELGNLILSPKEASTLKKGKYLEGYSYDETSEKTLIESRMPEDRKVQLKGVKSNG